MSSSKSVKPVNIILQPSRYLLGFAILSHMLALSAVLLSPLPPFVSVVLLVAVTGSLTCHLASMGWLNSSMQRRCWLKRQVRSINWQASGQWELMMGDGLIRTASLLPTTVIFPWLVSLHFKFVDAPWYSTHIQVLLLPDTTDADSFRRLRVRLRTEPSADGDDSAG